MTPVIAPVVSPVAWASVAGGDAAFLADEIEALEVGRVDAEAGGGSLAEQDAEAACFARGAVEACDERGAAGGTGLSGGLLHYLSLLRYLSC